MIELLTASFLIGFLGSMHCVGMCGGLVTALSMSQPKTWWTGLISYQLGRITTYTFLGLIAGIIGVAITQTPWLSQAQQGLAIVAGVLMIIFGLNLAGWLADPLVNVMTKITSVIGLTRWVQRATTSRMPMSWLMVGLFNGLLPCGLVFAGLALSLTAGNIVLSAGMMFAFGLGTVPAMMFIPIVLKTATPKTRSLVLKIAAVLLIIFGVITMIRGSSWMHAMHGIDHSGHEMVTDEDMNMDNMGMEDLKTTSSSQRL